MKFIDFSPVRGGGRFIWRRLLEYAADRAMLRGSLAACTYRLGLQGSLSIKRIDIDLTPARRLQAPLTLAFASDFHAGPTTHPAVYSAMFEALESIAPSVLLLGGDFVSCDAEYAAILAPGLAACRPTFGKFAVMGNHDLYAGDNRVAQILSQAGVTTLINTNIRLPAPFDGISICGIDDPWIGKPDLDAAFDNASEVRIFLTHSPDGMMLLNGQSFDIAFAGHTHGGQIALADGTPLYVPNGPLCRRYAHGRFQIAGNGCLIVSRGIGCSTLPIRINADPEIIVCRIR